MKKILCVLMCAVLAFAVCIPAAAAADRACSNVSAEAALNNETSFSEFETILKLKKASDAELASAGYSDSDINEIKSISLEDELLERAKLSDPVLHAYGYTDAQISMLKSYDGSTITLDSPMMALSATCTGSFSVGNNCSASVIRAHYSWNWSNLPFSALVDKVVCCWQACDSNGYYIDATASSYYALVKFYHVNTGAYYSQDYISGVSAGTEDAVYFDVDTLKYVAGDNYYWAKSGTVYLSLIPGGQIGFNYVDFGASYGHKTVDCSISYSISGSLSISFSPSGKISKLGVAYARISSNGNIS